MRLFTILLLAAASSALWAQNPVVVSGQVTDSATGLPIEDATVSIGDQTRFTDSAGHYMLDPMAPGSATVRVEARGYLAFQKSNPDDATVPVAADQAIHNFKLAPTAIITGRISAPDSEWRRAGFAVTLLKEDFSDGVRRFELPTQDGLPARANVSTIGAEGEFQFKGLEPGRYMVYAARPAGVYLFVARDKDGKPLPPKHEDEGYVQTFFPGTTDFAAAIPITVVSGEARTADFTLVKRPLYRVSGTTEGRVDGPNRTVQVESLGDGASHQIYSGQAADGKFVVEGLPRGSYAVRAVLGPGNIQPGATSSFQFEMFILSMNVRFTITDHDITDLHLTAEPRTGGPLSTTGTFRLAGAGPLPGGLAVQFAYPFPGGESTPIPASPDGVFWLTGQPGEYSVRPVVPPSYAVTEIRSGGGNYPFSLIPLDGNAIDSSITIVLSDQPGTISGAFPVPAKIALLPDPLPANFDFRAIRVAATNDRGGFVFNSIAPGRYKALALTGDDRRQDHDMTLLGPRLGPADAFEVTAGQNLTITLRP